MNSREALKVIREYAQENYGSDLDEVALKKAFEKLKRWLRAAYGQLAWDECYNIAYTWDIYYRETLKDKTCGRDTLNRKIFNR